MSKTIVSIKELYYAEPIKTIAAPANGLTGTEVKALLADTGTKKITNTHDTTFTYEEAEASVTDYINQMSGQIYFRDSTPGSVQMSFSVGQYEYQTKADLQGGKATSTSWERAENQSLIYKTLIAVTKDGTYIVFPNASISARGGMVESKLLGLMLAGVAMETGVEGLASEKWFDASEIAR